jgi:hypothetical protein
MRLSTVLVLILLASAACYAARVVPPSALELRIEELEKRVAELEKSQWPTNTIPCPMPFSGGYIQTPYIPSCPPYGGHLNIATSGRLMPLAPCDTPMNVVTP